MTTIPGTNSGHGHIYARPDGIKVRCGGPGICPECAHDREQLYHIPARGEVFVRYGDYKILTARVAELEKERDASAEDARAMQERLQRAVQGAMTLRRALDIIVNIRPLGATTYPECYSRMRAVALDALGDDGPPGPKHPPRVP